MLKLDVSLQCISNLAMDEGNDTADRYDCDADIMSTTNIKQQQRLTSSGDLKERDSYANTNKMAVKPLSSTKDENKSVSNCDGVVMDRTSSSNNLSLTTDRLHADCLPPGYLVSI